MRLNSKKILVTFLLVIELILVNLTYQSFLHKEINKEEKTVEKKQFAMFIKEDNEYVEYKGDSLFPEGYFINNDLSKCVDENDNVVDNAISSMGSSVTITSSKTIYCTLYFDKNETLEYLRSKDSINALSKNIVGDMYRYQGIYSDDIRNYICLDNCCKTEECEADDNDDMYRIIGINENGELKVIKKTALTEAMQWHTVLESDTEWPDSDLFHRLNDSEEGTYKDNSFYSTLNQNLKNIIVAKDWLYGDYYPIPTYDGNNLYSVETGILDVIHYIKENDNKVMKTYKWNKSINAYLGLMHMYDYLYAYKTNDLDAGKPGSNVNAVNSWIHISHNEVDYPLNSQSNRLGSEWLITRFGYNETTNNNNIYSRAISLNGTLGIDWITYREIVRPVFYLSSDIELNGEGSLTNPFTIKNLDIY